MRTTTFCRRHIAEGVLAAAAVLGAVLPIGTVSAAPQTIALKYPIYTDRSSALSVATATSTVLSTSPASHVDQGAMETLTARVTPATAVGTVQFKDRATPIGPPVSVSNDGIAVGSTSKLSAGTHVLTAAFTPADPSHFAPSTSPPVTLVVGGSTDAPPVANSPVLPKLPQLPQLPQLPLVSSPGSPGTR